MREAEAALLWVKHAAAERGVRIGRVFLGGHSQGGYLVTRLNTLPQVDGVVANAPGPLDLVYRCGLEERGKEAASAVCGRLRAAFGATTQNAEAYASRSLLRFTGGHHSKLLVVQGLADAPIQLRSWPMFHAALEPYQDCRARTFLELPGFEHTALFRSAAARVAFGAFLREPQPRSFARRAAMSPKRAMTRVAACSEQRFRNTDTEARRSGLASHAATRSAPATASPFCPAEPAAPPS